jgi:ribosomal protein S3, eukaryotic/archaeal type
MPTTAKLFVQTYKLNAEIIEYLQNKLKEAGIDKIEIQQFAAGIRIIMDVEKPRLALGPHGLKIKEVEEEIKSKFGVKNIEIFVNEAKDIFLSPSIVANKIAIALERGIHFRRVANLMLKQIMDSGARGAEIVISGKLVSERARFEKFRAGVIPKSGDPRFKFVKEAKTSVLLKPGVYGIKVRIVPPVELAEDRIASLKEMAVANIEEHKLENEAKRS